MHLIILLIISLLFIASPASQAAQFDAGISIGEEGIRGFYLAMGDYYRVPQREVVIIRERGIPVEEMPVVLFIANRAKVKTAEIMDLRLRGDTWLNIMLRFGLSPEALYVPVKEVSGPPYGKAYGYYKNKPKKQWKRIVLSDDDVVNLVNLKFISGYHRYSPEEVIKLRSQGKTFVLINEEAGKYKKAKGDKEKKDKGPKGKGKGKKED